MNITSLASQTPLYRGKVREVYEVDSEHLLLVTSSRVSAFDVVFPEPVPGKGAVLNLISAWWFERTRSIIANHLVETRAARLFADSAPERDSLKGQVALVRRTVPVRFECVVRGHLDGSAWREYQQTGAVCGHELPAGLGRYDRLPQPIFTPATKAETGHDENITVARMKELYGDAETERLEKLSIELYNFAYAEVLRRGLLLLDTKFEFGIDTGGRLLLIDEIFTPDSSRYRFANRDEVLALDKQYLRDWLTEQGFTGEGTPPALPPEVVSELARRYERLFELITGETLPTALELRG